MFFEVEEVLGRELVFHEGHVYLVDTRKTPDAGWETGVIEIDMDNLLENEGLALHLWDTIKAVCHFYMMDNDWIIINYPNKREAVKGHNKIIKDIQKNGTEYAIDWVL